MTILGIDPGPVQSAYVLIDGYLMPETATKIDNHLLLGQIYTNDWHDVQPAVIEMVASYGMAVGADVFETCVWIGRFQEALGSRGKQVELVKRREVKLHHCLDSRAKDTNIRQALVDRFTPGEPNHGKGTKGNPGWFHGFHSDLWQAYALAVYAADKGL